MSIDVEAYPLQWPVGWPQTEPHKRQRARFDTSFARARDGVVEELRLMGVPRHHIVISTDIPLRRDGLPYANTRQPDNPGVAVYFLRNGEQKCIPCDRWDRIEDNVQAVRKTIEALRGLDRWGAKHMVDAAFEGFAALPEGSEAGWWTVLGVDRGAHIDELRRVYRALIKEHHPDYGGDVETFHRIQAAWAEMSRERYPDGGAA